MTDNQKARLVLDYLEVLDGEVVANLLNPYLTDEQLADLYDNLKKDGAL